MATDMHLSTRITVEDYHTMVADGRLNEDDRVELLDGEIIPQMSRDPIHMSALRRLYAALNRLIGPEWVVEREAPITLAQSEPEPDLVVLFAPLTRYNHRHPGPADIGLVIEIANTSLNRDQGRKQAIYAAANLTEYWIVNIPDACIEVYTLPMQQPTPRYTHLERFHAGDEVILTLADMEVGTISVDAILRNEEG